MAWEDVGGPSCCLASAGLSEGAQGGLLYQHSVKTAGSEDFFQEFRNYFPDHLLHLLLISIIFK